MDEIERQLKRYADEAVTRVPATPEAAPGRRSWLPVLAVAAVVALIGGPLGLFLVGRDADRRVETVPADGSPADTVPADEPPSPIRSECPIPHRDPEPGHLQIMLPWVTSGVEETRSSDFDGLHVVTLGPDTD